MAWKVLIGFGPNGSDLSTGSISDKQKPIYQNLLTDVKLEIQ